MSTILANKAALAPAYLTLLISTHLLLVSGQLAGNNQHPYNLNQQYQNNRPHSTQASGQYLPLQQQQQQLALSPQAPYWRAPETKPNYFFNTQHNNIVRNTIEPNSALKTAQQQSQLQSQAAIGDQFRLITKRQLGDASNVNGATSDSTLNAPASSSFSLETTDRASVSMPASRNRSQASRARPKRSDDACSDRLCYGLPMGCLDRAPFSQNNMSLAETGKPSCSVLVTSKHLIDPVRPAARDIHFELVAMPVDGRRANYAAVGFSETGRMAGLVSECVQRRDPGTTLNVIKLRHSYNIAGAYQNVPVTILSGIRELGVAYENGYYQCRWVVESAVEFTYEDINNGSLMSKREDLGYRNYHILLASGPFDEENDVKSIHSERISSVTPISLAQTGHIKSLGTHILIRIHGSLMIAIWLGLVTLSVILARYYKNEWSNSKLNNVAIWFVVHRAFMLISWFGTIISIIFAFMYTESYHPGLHQISGTTCLVLASVQILGGLLRPSTESNKRVYFNWAHFVCGNLSYLFAMVCIVTAAYLAPAHLPPLYIWVVVAFVATYVLVHFMLTVHQYIIHKSSKLSITPMSDLNDTNSSSATYSSCGFVADSFPKEKNSTFRQVMLGTLVTILTIFIVLLISLVNIR